MEKQFGLPLYFIKDDKIICQKCFDSLKDSEKSQFRTLYRKEMVDYFSENDNSVLCDGCGDRQFFEDYVPQEYKSWAEYREVRDRTSDLVMLNVILDNEKIIHIAGKAFKMAKGDHFHFDDNEEGICGSGYGEYDPIYPNIFESMETPDQIICATCEKFLKEYCYDNEKWFYFPTDWQEEKMADIVKSTME